MSMRRTTLNFWITRTHTHHLMLMMPGDNCLNKKSHVCVFVCDCELGMTFRCSKQSSCSLK